MPPFVFGGSFNPIHNRHLQLARFARDERGFDKVLFVPNGNKYKKKSLAGVPPKLRLEMVQAAIVGEEGIEVLNYRRAPRNVNLSLPPSAPACGRSHELRPYEGSRLRLPPHRTFSLCSTLAD